MKPCVVCTLIVCATALAIAAMFVWVLGAIAYERDSLDAQEFILLHPELVQRPQLQKPSVEIVPERGHKL